MILRKPCIYMIQNRIDRKVYIGQTNRTLDERLRVHKSRLKRNSHENKYLQSAWNKYGEENFIFKVLENCSTDELDEREKFWIKKFDSINKNNGYNFESGGSLNKKLSIETRRLKGKPVILTNTMECFYSASEAARKYSLSQGSISNCCRGIVKSAGKLPSGEYSVWVFAENFDFKKDYFFQRHEGAHNPRAKKVICLTTNKVFDTMKDAGLYYNIKSYLKISEVCRGKRKHCGKLKCGTKLSWAYV